jgi:hypothetical protein
LNTPRRGRENNCTGHQLTPPADESSGAAASRLELQAYRGAHKALKQNRRLVNRPVFGGATEFDTVDEDEVLLPRVRVEIMRSQKCRIAGFKYQSGRITINPVIFTRTRTIRRAVWYQWAAWSDCNAPACAAVYWVAAKGGYWVAVGADP